MTHKGQNRNKRLIVDKCILDKLYVRYNRKCLVHPDPLEFLYVYPDIKDREIVGMIASSLAYGRVAQILKSVDRVLSVMEGRPYQFIINTDIKEIKKLFKGFKHRFTDEVALARLLSSIKDALTKHGSLNALFLSTYRTSDQDILPSLGRFVSELTRGSDNKGLLPNPDDGSACKRLNLFLRWMVRSDDVDPGGWIGLDTSKLIIPLDTHMHRISRVFGFTKRNAADLKTAIEITGAFGAFDPEDPVKYDFALTRFGIRDDMPSLANMLENKLDW